MKDNIHPQYGYVVFRDRSAGKAFLTRSTLVAKAASLPTIEWEDGNTYSLVNVEVSSYSHPFYTGRNVVLDTAGQVQKFNKRYGRSWQGRRLPASQCANHPHPLHGSPADGSWLAKRD